MHVQEVAKQNQLLYNEMGSSVANLIKKLLIPLLSLPCSSSLMHHGKAHISTFVIVSAVYINIYLFVVLACV